MTEFTAEQEAQSREFVKTAALAAVHINAVNEAVKLGDMLLRPVDTLDGFVIDGANMDVRAESTT
ncbi:hypothetical protein SEA_FORREST_205 [Streptomyces phage Forrest]|nr:hypothetical protein SEA_FORREST_205 [Streptomyces phage Forrest]